jgi:hypothetical protein
LRRRYDWVINAKRSLLNSNEELRFREFRKIVEQIARNEREGDRGSSPTVRQGSSTASRSPR